MNSLIKRSIPLAAAGLLVAVWQLSAGTESAKPRLAAAQAFSQALPPAESPAEVSAASPPSAAAADLPVDFDTQIVPIFTKAGCNAGACHGSAAGRGNFHLSLFGGRPQDDYAAVVHEFSGRRVNLTNPAASLVLQKPTGMQDHGGDVRLDYEGSDAKLLERWIAEGAKRLERAHLVAFHVSPESVVLDADSREPIRLQARAEFSDGTKQDVTHWTVFTAADPAAVEITGDAQGAEGGGSVFATVQRPGQHVVIARYLDRVVPLELLSPVGQKPVNLDWQNAANLVDRHVLKKLTALRLQPAPLADDATFLRRVTLDLTGRLPTPEERDTFLKQCAANSAVARLTTVNRLLASPQFTNFWTFRFAQLLRIRSAPKDTRGADMFSGWVYDQMANARPLDEMVRDLLLASGNTHQVGPANFYRVSADARLEAEYASELLMGARLRCANCHNHPLDRWTQDDYHGLAAIFAQVQSGQIIQENPRGQVTHPATGEPAVRRIPGEDFISDDQNGREALAAWLLADDNPYFARAWVNRLWKFTMGRGLVEPTDDLRATNPATHPELLAMLTADFVEHGYDIRHTLRMIVTSDAYAAGSAPANADATSLAFYVYATPKALPAEVLADATSDVTGVWSGYVGYPAGTRAINIYDGAVTTPALEILGRCARDESCETTDVEAQRGLASKLHFLNGDWINDRLADSTGRLRKLVDGQASDAQIVREFYLRAFTREPSTAELNYWTQAITEAGPAGRQAVLQDFAWSVLNSQAFTHNY